MIGGGNMTKFKFVDEGDYLRVVLVEPERKAKE